MGLNLTPTIELKDDVAVCDEKSKKYMKGDGLIEINFGIRKCFLCGKAIDEKDRIRINSMEAYLQFRIGRITAKKHSECRGNHFICLGCREDLRKGLEKESGIEIL